jgi:hypothetical protein
MHAVYYTSQKRKTIHGIASWLQKFRRDLSIPEFPLKTKI